MIIPAIEIQGGLQFAQQAGETQSAAIGAAASDGPQQEFSAAFGASLRESLDDASATLKGDSSRARALKADVETGNAVANPTPAVAEKGVYGETAAVRAGAAGSVLNDAGRPAGQAVPGGAQGLDPDTVSALRLGSNAGSEVVAAGTAGVKNFAEAVAAKSASGPRTAASQSEGVKRAAGVSGKSSLVTVETGVQVTGSRVSAGSQGASLATAKEAAAEGGAVAPAAPVQAAVQTAAVQAAAERVAAQANQLAASSGEIGTRRGIDGNAGRKEVQLGTGATRTASAAGAESAGHRSVSAKATAASEVNSTEVTQAESKTLAMAPAAGTSAASAPAPPSGAAVAETDRVASLDGVVGSLGDRPAVRSAFAAAKLGADSTLDAAVTANTAGPALSGAAERAEQKSAAKGTDAKGTDADQSSVGTAGSANHSGLHSGNAVAGTAPTTPVSTASSLFALATEGLGPGFAHVVGGGSREARPAGALKTGTRSSGVTAYPSTLAQTNTFRSLALSQADTLERGTAGPARVAAVAPSATGHEASQPVTGRSREAASSAASAPYAPSASQGGSVDPATHESFAEHLSADAGAALVSDAGKSAASGDAALAANAVAGGTNTGVQGILAAVSVAGSGLTATPVAGVAGEAAARTGNGAGLNGVAGAGSASALSLNATAGNATAGLGSSAVEPHRTLAATPTTLEVGVPNGTQGWLRIRAEVGSEGQVNASLAAGSNASQEMLHRELPALNAYLHSEQMPVTASVAERSFAAAAGSDGLGRHSSAEMTGNGPQNGGTSGAASEGAGGGTPGSGGDGLAAVEGRVSGGLTGGYDGRSGMGDAPVAQLTGEGESGRWLNVRA